MANTHFFTRKCLKLMVFVGLHAFVTTSANAQSAAKDLFGKASKPADMAARSIGSYARGCLAGGRQIAVDGPHWQAMRLSRNRNWGHPVLVKYLERLATDAKKARDWNGLLVGDLAQPRGGPMLTGHASHQIGLDADIWLTEMPDRTLSRKEREEMTAVSVLNDNTRTINSRIWTDSHAKILKRAASYPEVARIFVHPAIKQQLCNWKGAGSGKDRLWLRRIRPWYGHHYHFHVRLACPSGYAGCKNQDPPPAGDGCGKALAWWLGPEPWAPPKPGAKPAPRKRPITLAGLPNACRKVLAAPAPDGSPSPFSKGAARAEARVPIPIPRPVIQ